MKHTLSLKTTCDEAEKQNLLDLFTPEDKNLGNDRANYVIKEEDQAIIFEVNALDAVALRAAITSITKTLDVYERTQEITNN